MYKGVPDRLRKRLLTLLGARSAEDADQDELNSVLLQVTLALMMIFMIAFFIFMGKVEGEITRIDTFKQQIAEAEAASILRAVERTADHYRLRYGLREFMIVDPVTGNKSFTFSDVIRSGSLDRTGPSGSSFVSGAAAAWHDYRDPAQLEKQWMKTVCAIAGQTAEKDPQLLRTLVRDGVLRVRSEVIEVQALAAAAMQEHFAGHPERVSDPEIRRLLAGINRAPASPERDRMLRELAILLRRYVYNNLAARCGVPMLETDRHE